MIYFKQYIYTGRTNVRGGTPDGQKLEGGILDVKIERGDTGRKTFRGMDGHTCNFITLYILYYQYLHRIVVCTKNAIICVTLNILQCTIACTANVIICDYKYTTVYSCLHHKCN